MRNSAIASSLTITSRRLMWRSVQIVDSSQLWQIQKMLQAGIGDSGTVDVKRREAFDLSNLCIP